MSFDNHKNFAYSTVATAPSPATSGTSLHVQTGDGALFPTAPFNATVWPTGVQPTKDNAEIVRVTVKSTDTFTITRAQEASTARSIGIGDQIAATITAKTLTDVESSADLLHTVASSGSTQTITYSTANTWDITLTANCTFTLAGFTNGDPDFLTLILRQDGTGTRTVTWPAITWIGTGIAPTLQTAPSSVDTVILFSVDGGTTVYGVAQTSASGLRSGTSFPGSPSGGDLFYRTDRRVIYEYDATAVQWLSLDRMYVPFGPGTALHGAATSGVAIGYLPIFEDVYIEEWIVSSQVGTTNNGSNYWTYQLYKDPAVAAGTIVTTIATDSDTVNTWVEHTASIAAVFSAATYKVFEIDRVKTGAPGNSFAPSVLVVRSVG